MSSSSDLEAFIKRCRRRIGLAALLAFLALLVMGIFTRYDIFQPKKYFRAEATLSAPTLSLHNSALAYLLDGISEEYLLETVDRLELTKKLSPGQQLSRDDAASLLGKHMLLTTRAQDIRVLHCFHEDRQLAADIANTVAKVIIEKIRAQAEASFAEMKEELDAKRLEVNKAYETAAGFRERYKIDDPSPEETVVLPMTPAQKEDENAREQRTEYQHAKTRYIATRLLHSALLQRGDAARFDTNQSLPTLVEAAVPSKSAASNFHLPGKTTTTMDKTYVVLMCGFSAGLAVAYALLMGVRTPGTE